MKITELFEAQFLKVPDDYPQVLEDVDAIVNYVFSISDEDTSEEAMYEYFNGYSAKLQLLPVASLHPGNEDHNIPNSRKEKRYAKMDPATMPPILVDNGEVIDGNHRFRIAKAKDLTHIWAYVLQDE